MAEQPQTDKSSIINIPPQLEEFKDVFSNKKARILPK